MDSIRRSLSARAGFTLSAFEESLALVGGFNNNQIYGDIWTFPVYSESIEHKKWEKKSDFVFSNEGGRYGHGACPMKTGLVLFGGMSHNGNTQNDVVRVNTNADGLAITVLHMHAPWKARVWFGYACVPGAATIVLAAGYHKTETSASTLIDDMWYSKTVVKAGLARGAFSLGGTI